MSGLVGLFRLDGRPLPPADFERLFSQAREGFEPCGRYAEGPVGLGHYAVSTEPRSRLGARQQPLRAVLDGHIDNRVALAAELGLSLDPNGASDASLLCAAYERWGLGCVDRLVGDYGFALWDARIQRLFCARDPTGVRPLFYAVGGKTLLVASGLTELVKSPLVSLDINEGLVGEHLSGMLHSTSETVYEDVQRLPPGHLLTAGREGLRISKHWFPENIPESQLSAEDAAQHFLELFRNAVRAMAPSDTPLAADLSGGVDSSSVVALLAQLDAAGELARPFEAFSLTFPGLPCDETEYSSLLHERYGFRWHRVPIEPLPPVDYQRLAEHYLDFPGYPNGIFAVPALALARERGMRVVLGGDGGDDWLDAAPTHARCFDWVRGLRFRALRAELKGYTPAELVHALRPLAGLGLEALGLRPQERRIRRLNLPPWLRREFVRRIDLADRVLAPLRRWPHGVGWARGFRIARVLMGARVATLDTEARLHKHQHLVKRYPFHDRRLVEFILSLPEELCASPSVFKLVLRDAMRGVLPEKIRLRRTKADFSHVLERTLATDPVRECFGSLGRGSMAAWVDAEAAKREYERFLRGEAPEHAWSLWGLYGIHTWQQALVNSVS